MPEDQPITAPTVRLDPTVLPDPMSQWGQGYAIVSPRQLPTHAGHRRAAGEVFPGLWVYPFASEDHAVKALDRLRLLAADRGQVQP